MIIRSVCLLIFFISNFSYSIAQEKFTFVQLCDPQFGMSAFGQEIKSSKYYEQDKESLKQAVKQINDLNPDFVIICGDFVHDANDTTFSDFKAIIKDFAMPCYLTAGNHDVGNIPTDSSLKVYRNFFGKDYYKFKNKGCYFLVTNSLLWVNTIEDETEKHDQWFKSKLLKYGEKKRQIFVIGHYPLFTNEICEENHYYNFPKAKRQELLNLFAENNVVAYLSGHKHEIIVNTHQNIQFVCGESTSYNFDKSPLGFRVWEVSKDTVKHHFIPLVLN